MKAALTGPPQSGRSTVFRVLTGQPGTSRDRREIGVVDIPDWRLAYLNSLFRPRKVTHARMELSVLNGADEDFFRDIMKHDVIVEVVPGFLESSIGDTGSARRVLAHFDEVNLSFVLRDLQIVENRLERLRLNKAKPVNQMEPALLARLKEPLEAGTPLRSVPLDSFSSAVIRNFDLLSVKPFVLLLNVSEDMLRNRDLLPRPVVQGLAEETGCPVVIFCAPVEEEISRLPDEERADFLAEYGLDEPGPARLARTVMKHLHLITFFTVVSEEVRAWVVPEGTTAVKAAGKIHTDMEKGFIRAEVIAFDDLHRFGSVKAVKEYGLYRSEGRTYVVKDGDILLIRFSS